MIKLHGPQGAVEPAAQAAAEAYPVEVVWIDLDDPSAEEAERVEACTGIRVPSRKALSEVENSSRLRRLKTGFSLSTPMVTFDKLDTQLKPLGFVLTRDRLVTVRFHELRAFAEVKKRIDTGDGPGTTSTEIFLLLMEELVDSLADSLEDMGADLDAWYRSALAQGLELHNRVGRGLLPEQGPVGGQTHLRALLHDALEVFVGQTIEAAEAVQLVGLG
ncbi:MAG: hypothetical protein EOO74_07490 [Myxococcales bacterium]|nr:MAG: hypothetical protein EOO74_07490 [Myxococcales bacterium]